MVKKILILLMLIRLAEWKASACDLCGCYTPQLETMSPVSPETTLGQQAGMAVDR